MSGPPTPQLPAGGAFNVVEAIPGVVTQPVPTMQRIVAARPWLVALIYYIVVSAIGGLASLATRPFDSAALAQLPPEARQQVEPLLNTFLSPATIIGSSIVLAPIGLFLGAGILWLIARLLGGQGPYSALFSTAAFASTPGLLAAPLIAIAGLAGPGFAPLGSLLSFVASIWTLVLEVIGIRESMGFSTGRAVATLLIPLGVVIVLCCVLAIALLALIGAAITGSGVTSKP